MITKDNKSFDIRDLPSNVIGDKVQSRDEAKGKIEAEVIISCRRSKINLYFHINFHVLSFKQDLGMIKYEMVWSVLVLFRSTTMQNFGILA